tara:strand:+ start:93 stop:266 length:174 start_codon:yes stop_codon:yes gene_type:complete
MKEYEIQRMRDIDHKAQLGIDVSQEDKVFFNVHYETMLEELEDEYNDFKHHSGKFSL